MLNLRGVDLNLLPVFEAVYEERSLSRGAAPPRDDAAGGQPCADSAPQRVRGPAVHPAIARRRAHAGRRRDLRQAAWRAHFGARRRHRVARLRGEDVAPGFLRRDPASAGAADGGAPAPAPRRRGAEREGRVQHAIAADRARARVAGRSLRRRRRLAAAAGRPVERARRRSTTASSRWRGATTR